MFLRRVYFVVFLFLFLLVYQVFSYDNLVIHPRLSSAAVEVYNKQNKSRITDEQSAWIVEGAIAEDTDPRYLNHFYNPKTGQGLDSGVLQGISAKDWAQHQDDSVSGDYSEGAILDNYRKGNLQRAWQGVGHILHLVQDMSVPAHVRNDAHPEGDPFEAWAEKYGNVNLDKVEFIKVNNLNQAFDQLATYTYDNFFSKDTLNLNNFNNYRKTNKIIDGKKIEYLINLINGKEYKIMYSKNSDSIKPLYQVNNDFYLNLDYWNMLSPKAVGYSAGVIDYFVEEFAKIDGEEKDKLSFWRKIENSVLNIFENWKYDTGDTLIASRKIFDKTFGIANEVVDTSKENIGYFAEANKEIIEDVIEQGMDVKGEVLSSFAKATVDMSVVETVTEEKVESEDKNNREKTINNSGDVSVLATPAELNVDNVLKIDVERVIDGDTIVLTNGEKVRYIGVDTPELKKSELDTDECLAWVARLRNMELLASGDLELLEDEAVDKDAYGRSLRYVYINNSGNKIFVNEQLAREGLAETFFCQAGWDNCPTTSDDVRKQLILNASKEAKQNERGLFSNVCSEKKEEIKEELKENLQFVKNKEEKEIPKKETESDLEDKKTAQDNWMLVFGGGGSSKENEDLSVDNFSEESGEIETGASQTEDSTTRVPLVKTFNMIDLVSESSEYTASTTVDIYLDIDNQDLVEGYYLGEATSTPEIDDSYWSDILPESFVLSFSEGEKVVYIYLKYNEDLITEGVDANITLDTELPLAPTINDLEDAYSDIGFSVSWMENEEDDITDGQERFDIQYKTEDDWQDWLIATTSTSTVFDIFLEEECNLFFRARVVDPAGNFSDWSAEVDTEISDFLSDYVVISEVQVGDEEFIELYNASQEDVDISGWYVAYYSANKNWNEPYRKKVFPDNSIIYANRYWLISIIDGEVELPDYSMGYSSHILSNEAGSVAIFPWDPAQKTAEEASLGKIDAVAWGNVDYVFESATSTSPDISQSIERKASASSTRESMSLGGEEEFLGNKFDSNNNSNDFVIKETPDPQNNFSASEPTQYDVVIPDAIDDLEVQKIYTNNNSIKLIWESPNNANISKEACYDVRYEEKEDECNLSLNWNNALAVASSTLPTPLSQSPEVEIDNLLPDTEYCFAIMTYNGEFWSGLSNQVSEITKNIFNTDDLSKPIFEYEYNLATQTLTAENSPYYFGGHSFDLEEGRILTIEPGVVIKFGEKYQGQWYMYPVIFFDNGKIIAEGTENNPIIFTSILDDSYGGDSNNDGETIISADSYWGGFQINSSNNVFDNVVIKYGGADNRGLMTFYNSENNQIKNSFFSNNYRGIVFRAASSTNQTIIENNIFQNNAGTVISLFKSANPLIRYNDFFTNETVINFRDSSIPTVNYNNIYNNSGYGAFTSYYELSGDVDFKYNWWGSANGPTYVDNLDGDGAEVSDIVDYSDWLTAEY